MVMRYDVISSRWPRFFRNKSKICGENDGRNYLCVVLRVKCKKVFILTVLTLDGDHVW